MARKQPPKRKKAPQRKKGSSKSSKARKQQAPQAQIEPLYGDIFDKFINKRANWLALGLMLLLILIVFGDYLFGPYLYLFKDIGSDTINDVFPNYVHRNRLLREEGFTSWSFMQGMGNSVGTWFSVNPFVWMIYLSSKNSLPYVMNWTSVFYLAIAGIFSFQYLKTVGFSKYVVIVGSLIYVFSGYVMGVHSWYAYNGLIFAAPLMLWGTELLLKKNNPIVLPIAIYFIAGPRLVTFAFFLIVYSFFRYVLENGWNWKGLIIFWLKIGGLSALGIMMASYFFGQTVMSMLGSARISGEASQVAQTTETPVFAFNSYIVNVTSILRTFATDMLGGAKDFKGYRNYLESPFYYVGLASLLLIPQAFYHAKKWRKALFGGLLAFWLMICIFPYFRFAYFLFVTDHFRSFCLHASLIFLFVSLYALNEIVKSGKVHLPTLGLSLVACLVLLNYPYFDDGRVNEGLQMAANVFLVLSAGSLFAISRPRLKYIGLGALLLTLLAELAVFNHHITHDRDPLTKAEYKAGALYGDSSMEALKQLKEKDSGLYRIQKDFASSPAMHYSLNDAMVQGFFSTPTYQSINKQSYLDFLVAMEVMEAGSITRSKWVQGLRPRPLLQHFASVKYVLRQDSGSDITPHGFNRIGGVDNIRMFENSYFIPMGFTYDKVTKESEFRNLPRAKKDICLVKAAVIPDEDFDKLSSLQPFKGSQIDPSQFTYPSLQEDIRELKNGAFQLTEFHHDHLIGKVNMPKEKLLFFSIPYDQGWSMLVDGEEVEVLKVNIGFLGGMVPAGEHEVELVHSKSNMMVMKIISVIALIAFTVLIFWYRKNRNRFQVEINELGAEVS